MEAETFEQRLQAVAMARSWPERVVQAVRDCREELAASPEATAIRVARKFGLQGFDESLLSQLHQGKELPLGTVWSPSEPTGEAPDPTPSRAEKVRTLMPVVAEVPPEAERTLQGATLATTEPTLANARAVLAMVARAHDQGFVLRNLSLGNLIVGPLGEVVLVDPTAPPTAAHSSPEQAAGESSLTPASDVFALGTLLFEWFGGTSLFGQVGPSETLEAIKEDRRRTARAPLPPLIDKLVDRATRPTPERRYPHARAMLRALSTGTDASERLAGADEAREEARSIESAEPRDPAELDRAGRLRHQARVLEHRALFDAIALADGPSLRDAHARLRSDPSALAEALLRHTEDLGIARPGKGRLQLHTRQPAKVDLYRYDLREGRLWPEPLGSLGETPVDIRLPPGSYVAVIHPEVGPDVRYPLWIDHYGYWNGTPRDADAPLPIELPGSGDRDRVHVAAGWARLGQPAQWAWVDGFAMQRHPVSTSAYLAFLDHLSSSGASERAEALAPTGATRGAKGWAIDGWDLDWPVTGVSIAGARAYATWRAALDDLAWALPTQVQWEKAARGADARRYPWGPTCDPAFARLANATPVQSPTLAADASPYGIRGLGGNVRDWVEDPAVEGFAWARGGCFAGDADDLVTWRGHLVQASGSPLVGFRLVHPI